LREILYGHIISTHDTSEINISRKVRNSYVGNNS
jgi:hypothetical protein